MIGRPTARFRLTLSIALLAALAGTAGAQSARRPPAAGTAAAAPVLDRRVFPFYPLQPLWQANFALVPAAAPAVGDGRVFVSFTDGYMVAYSLYGGTPSWSGRGVAVQPLVVDDRRLLVTLDRSLAAYQTTNGAPIWMTPLPAPAAHAPVVRSGWVLVALDDGTLLGLRGDSGKVVWTTKIEGAAAAPPVIEGDRFYVAAKGGPLHARAIADGSPLWSVALEGDVTAVAAVEGHAFAATAGRWLFALDARKGQTRWRYRLGGAATGLAVDEDRVVAVMLDQSVRAFKIGSGAQAWRQPLSFRPASGPVVIGASVLVTGFSTSVRVLDRKIGDNQGLYQLPIGAEGVSLETLATGPLPMLGPTLFDDVVVLITQQGWLYVLRRAFDPPATPVTVLPGLPLAVPEPPPGWVAPVDTPKTDAASAPAASTPGATSPTPPAGATPAAPPPAGGTPPRTPPAPPAR